MSRCPLHAATATPVLGPSINWRTGAGRANFLRLSNIASMRLSRRLRRFCVLQQMCCQLLGFLSIASMAKLCVQALVESRGMWLIESRKGVVRRSAYSPFLAVVPAVLYKRVMNSESWRHQEAPGGIRKKVAVSIRCVMHAARYMLHDTSVAAAYIEETTRTPPIPIHCFIARFRKQPA